MSAETSSADDPSRARSLMRQVQALLDIEADVVGEGTSRIIKLYHEILPLLDSDHPWLLGVLRNIAMVLMRRFMAHGNTADIDDCVGYLGEFLTILPSRDGPAQDEQETIQTAAVSLKLLGDAFVLRFKHLKNLEDIDAAIDSYRMTLVLSSVKDSSYQMFLQDLVEALALRFLECGRKEDIDEATRQHREIHLLSQTDDKSLLWWLHQLGKLLMSRYNSFGLIVDLDEATKSYRKTLPLLPLDSATRYDVLSELVEALKQTFEAKGQLEYLNEAVEYQREAIACLRVGVAATSIHLLALNVLGALLMLRYKQLPRIEDFNEAMDSVSKAVALADEHGPERGGLLRNLAHLFQIRFQLSGHIDDIDVAIRYQRELLASDVWPTTPESLASFWLELARSHTHRFVRSYAMDDIEEAISSVHKAISLNPHDAASVSFLGMALSHRFRATSDMKDIEEAIQCQYRAIDLDLPERHTILPSLAMHIRRRYAVTRVASDLEQAIDLFREAFALCPTGESGKLARSEVLGQLADALFARYDLFGKAEDLQEALNAGRESVVHTAGTPIHYTCIDSFANNLAARVGRNEQLLDDGIRTLRGVLPGFGPCPYRARLLRQLGQFYLANSRRSSANSALEDLEAALTCLREGLALAPRNPNNLSSLAAALMNISLLFNRTDDIDDAINFAREGIKLRPPGSVARSTGLSELAMHLCQRFNAFGRLDDVQEAVAVGREALSILSDTPHSKQEWHPLLHLARALFTRYGKLRELPDLEEATLLLREALNSVPSDHLQKRSILLNLAGAIDERRRVLGRIEDYKEALEICQRTVAAHLPSHVYLCSAKRKLACIYWSGGDHEQAFALFEDAVNQPTSVPQHRLNCAWEWTKLARESGHSSTLRAYMKALELLDTCLTTTPTMELQQRILTLGFSWALAPNAASCAMERGELEIAVEALEQGRALLWSRLRGYRRPLEKLHKVDPHLASEFESVCQRLEDLTTSFGGRNILEAPEPNSPFMHAVGLDFDVKVTKNRKLSDAFERIKTQIQQLDGFSSFFQATPFTTLQTAAKEGPIILLNVDQYRADALILRATGRPHLVPLPENLPSILPKLSAQLVEVDRMNRNADRYGVARPAKRSNMTSILQTLWKVVCEPIAHALQEIGQPKGSRVWWCPVGRLCSLPLHAAGMYDGKGVLVEGFPDLYISSYTPTLSSLITSRESATVRGGSVPRLLAVGQSHTLPKVKDEFYRMKNLFPSNVLKTRDGESADAATILNDLPDHPWVHFACHGWLDASSPFKYGFILHDEERLTLRSIMQARLPNAELAFLAACHSAAVDSKIPDEVLSLSAAMQFCGFRSIIGSLWTMNDSDGPVLAEAFYKHMIRNGLDNTDVRDSAEAVHLATKSMRGAGIPLHRWATFVHLGI